MVFDDVVKTQAHYMNPYILEERQLNVTQMDVFSRLMRENIIFLGTEIDDYTANVIQAQLLFLQSVDPERDISIYLNSMLASPTYVDGTLVNVEFMTNFFFTTQNPLGIRLTAIWQWWLYLIIISVLACLAVLLCYLPLLRKAK